MQQIPNLREKMLESGDRSAEIGRLSFNFAGDTESVTGSKSYVRIHGLPPEVRAWSRANWDRRLHPDDRERVEQDFDSTVANSEATAVCTVYRIVRLNDGETRWLEVDSEIERDGEGKALRMLVEYRDVTVRRAAEEALRQSEKRLRNILDAMPQKVSVIRPDGSHEFINRQWYNYTGPAGPSEGGGCPFDAFHPEDVESARSKLQHSLETGEPCEVEARLRHHSGEFRWHLFRAVPIRDGEGRIERWCGTGTDIHDRKLSEEQSHLTENRTRLALEASQAVGTTEWDVLTGQVFVDAQAANFFSLDPASGAHGVPMRVFVEAIHPDDRPRVEARMASSLHFGGAYELEYRVIAPDEGMRWISDRGFVEHDADARPTRTRGVLIDVTRLKELQDANDLLSRELIHRMKNVFSVISALSSLSAKESSEDVQRYAKDFRNRLHTLSSALIYMEPQGYQQSVAPDHTVMGLLKVLLAPFAGEDAARLIFLGEDAPLGHCGTNPLALLVHELATNASKYGALSTLTGTITVSGKTESGSYQLTWQERGGPKLEEQPKRVGFGTGMAARLVSSQLGGSIDYAWDVDGLTVLVRVPLSFLSDGAASRHRSTPQSGRSDLRATVPAGDRPRSNGKANLNFLVGGGAMAARIREFDWSSSALGPLSGWHDSLSSAVGSILRKSHSMSIFWGPELIHIYNDAALEVFGPQQLGCPVSETWVDAWEAIRPQFAFVMQQGSPTWSEQRLLPVSRDGQPVDAWWTYSLTPIAMREGVGGVLMAFNEVPRPLKILPTDIASGDRGLLTDVLVRQ